MPCPGAMWTQPVPCSRVTKSPSRIGDNPVDNGRCVSNPSNPSPPFFTPNTR